MDDSDVAEAIAAVQSVDPESFRERVREDAEELKSRVTGGAFDNPQALIGLEHELFAVADPGDDVDAAGSLARVPRRLLEFVRFEKELGLHNAELTTRPMPLNADGLAAQEAAVRAQLRSAQVCVRAEGLRLVSDGIWTMPPRGETAREYLTRSVMVEETPVATNMSATPRYHAMGAPGADVRPAMRVEAPNVTLEADTVMPESLITSIQPHYQVPRAVNLPMYFRAAIRVAGPLLALAANAPLFPPDLYDTDDTDRILAEAHHDHRIAVFESVLNDPGGPDKVRFPRDIDRVEKAIDRLVGDPVLVPMEPELTGRFDDSFAHLRLKSGTYWRWVRPVFDGATRSDANARIEFRPLSAQPTVRDTIAFQAAFAGLMEGLPAEDHPAMELPWDAARENFYRAARNGLDAELTWPTPAGGAATSPRQVYIDVLEGAAEGLRIRGCSEEEIWRYLGPLRRRVRHGVSPADWRLRRVRQALEDGASFETAVKTANREYLAHQRETLLTEDFTAWIEDRDG